MDAKYVAIFTLAAGLVAGSFFIARRRVMSNRQRLTLASTNFWIRTRKS
jgi:hypothetical protein